MQILHLVQDDNEKKDDGRRRERAKPALPYKCNDNGGRQFKI